MESNKELTLEEVKIKCAELADEYDAMCKLADELQKKRDEEEVLKLERQLIARKKEIDEAGKALDEAEQHWHKLMDSFYHDYGYWYAQYNKKDYTSKMIDFFLI